MTLSTANNGAQAIKRSGVQFPTARAGGSQLTPTPGNPMPSSAL